MLNPSGPGGGDGHGYITLTVTPTAGGVADHRTSTDWRSIRLPPNRTCVRVVTLMSWMLAPAGPARAEPPSPDFEQQQQQQQHFSFAGWRGCQTVSVPSGTDMTPP